MREQFSEDTNAAVRETGADVEQLRRRLHQLEEKNALLKRAAAFFAKDNL